MSGHLSEAVPLAFGVDPYGSRAVSLQVDGNDLVNLTDIDMETGQAHITVFASSHPDARILFTGIINVTERGSDDEEGVGDPTPEDGVVDRLIEQGLVEEVQSTAPPEGMVAVAVEWFRGEQFSGEVWVEEGLEGDAFGEAVEDAIHNLSQPEENEAFAGCSQFEVTKKKIIPKEESNDD